MLTVHIFLKKRFNFRKNKGLTRDRSSGLILNDFAPIFRKMTAHYFAGQKSKTASLGYHRNLARAIERRDHSVEKVVTKAMEQSIEIWHELKRSVGT